MFSNTKKIITSYPRIMGARHLLHRNHAFSNTIYTSSRTISSQEKGHFQNKTVLITGGSRGLGLGFVNYFLKHGASVVFCATSESSISSAINSLQQNFPHIPTTTEFTTPSDGQFLHGLVCDVANVDQVSSMCRFASKLTQPASILINSAGICVESLLLRTNMDEVKRMFDINVLGTMSVTKSFLRHTHKTVSRLSLVPNPSIRVICIGSVVEGGSAGLSAYSASKSALSGFVKSMVLETSSLQNVPVTFNTVAPGYIATDMTSHLSPVQQEKILARIPLQRLGTIDEVAQVVGFLAGDMGAYINGQTIGVDGGM